MLIRFCRWLYGIPERRRIKKALKIFEYNKAFCIECDIDIFQVMKDLKGGYQYPSQTGCAGRTSYKDGRIEHHPDDLMRVLRNSTQEIKDFCEWNARNKRTWNKPPKRK